jgi:signal transduction histidine kinase
MGDLVLELVDGPLPMSDDYLARVVDEIVRNAFKFSDSGTKVLITLAESSGSAVLSVTDHGRGFSTEQITRIGAYMQFNRNIQEQQGLGLGLTIAKRLTEVHGGVMQIQSSQGSRTTVTLKLPLNIPWSNTPSAARLSGASPALSVAQYLEQLPG